MGDPPEMLYGLDSSNPGIPRPAGANNPVMVSGLPNGQSWPQRGDRGRSTILLSPNSCRLMIR